MTIAALPKELLEAVRRGCSGGNEIHAAYREAPSTIFEHPVTALEPDAVRDVASLLAKWNGDDVVRGLPKDAHAAKQLVGMNDLEDHPSQ